MAAKKKPVIRPSKKKPKQVDLGRKKPAPSELTISDEVEPPRPSPFLPGAGLYHYAATLAEVVDGDTVRLQVDCGFRISHVPDPMRIAGINAPEVEGENAEAGLRAKEWLQRTLQKASDEGKLTVVTHKTKTGTDKRSFARYIATIFIATQDVAAMMVEAGHARPIGERYAKPEAPETPPESENQTEPEPESTWEE